MIYRLFKAHIGSSRNTGCLKVYKPNYVFSTQNEVEGQEQIAQQQIVEGQVQPLQQVQQQVPPQQMKSKRQNYTATFLLSDKYQFYRNRDELKTEMQDKLKSFEQHIGLSLYNLEKIPLYSSNANSNHIQKNDYQSHKIQALKSMKAGNFTIPKRFVEDAIRKQDFQILEGFLTAQGYHSNWIIGISQISLILKLYNENPSNENRIKMLQNIGFCKYMTTGVAIEFSQKDKFFDENLSKVIHDIPSFTHNHVDKFRLLTSLIHLQGQTVPNKYNEKHISYLIRQLCNIKFGFEHQNLSNQHELKQFEKQLKQAIYITYGEKCLAKIIKEFLTLFPKYDNFFNAVSITIAVLSLLHSQLNGTLKINKLWPYTQLYGITSKNILKRQQKIFHQIIPKAIFQESSNPKLFQLYQQNFSKINSANLQSLEQLKQYQNILNKKILADLHIGCLKISTMRTLAKGLPPKVLKNQEVPLERNKTLTQKQFVRKLSKGNYLDALHYIDKNLSKNSVLSIEKQYQPIADRNKFQSQNDRALFILKLYMNQNAYKLIPQNLSSKDFQIDQNRQPRAQQPSSQLNQMKKQKIFAKNRSSTQVKQKKEYQRQIENFERIQKPKYNSHQKNKDPSKVTWNKSKKKSQGQFYQQAKNPNEQINFINQIQLQPVEEEKHSDTQQTSSKVAERKPIFNKNKGKFKFSTQKQASNDGYQAFRSTVKSMSQNQNKSSILSFDKCKTIQEVRNQFEGKLQFLDSNECNNVATNTKIPFIKSGSHLLCYYLIESSMSKTKKKLQKKNLEVKLDSSLGQIVKDYSVYLEKNSFSFALTQQTYEILLKDQTKNFHRKSFKTIVSHMIAYNNVISDRSAQLIAKIAEINKIGITLLEITALIIRNKIKLSIFALQKLISGLFLFSNLNQDSIRLYAQYCQLNNQRIRPKIFSSFFITLLKSNDTANINKAISRIVSIISQKPYYFSKQLSDKENAEKQKLFIKSEKERYYNNLYQIIKLATETSFYVLPQIFQQLFQTYLANKETQEMSAEQYCVALVVYAGNKDKFQEWIGLVSQKPQERVANNLYDQMIKLFLNNQKLQIDQKFDQIFALTLFKYPQRIDIVNFNQMLGLFNKYERPSAFSQFIDAVLRSNLTDMTKYRKYLFHLTSGIANDFNRNDLKDKLNLLFKEQLKDQRIKYRQRRQQQELKQLKQQEKEKKRKQDIANLQIKMETSEQKGQKVTAQSSKGTQKKKDEIKTAKAQVKPQETSKQQKKQKPEKEQKTKNQKSKQKKSQTSLNKSGQKPLQKSKQTLTQKKIPPARNISTWDNAPKKQKRNISLRKYFERYGRSTEEPQDKKGKDKDKGKGKK